VNEPTAPIEKQRLPNWIKRSAAYKICVLDVKTLINGM
jgi:hypothetical protein